MKYLAHIAEDGREQTVKDHLEGTADLAAQFASAFEAEADARLAALLHDMGKYTGRVLPEYRNTSVAPSTGSVD